MLIKALPIHLGMKGMNKAIVGVVLGIALVYGVLCMMLSAQHVLDAGEVSLFLFLPRGDEMGIDLAEHIGPLTDLYASFIDEIVGYVTDDADMAKYMSLVLVIAGFVLSAAGFAAKPTLDCTGDDSNPVQYLWTHRPKAFAKCLSAPWGLITGAWAKHKALVIVPIVLLPLYAVWAVMLTIFLIVPFLLAKGIIGAKISSAAKKEAREYDSTIRYAACPRCKRNFARPKVKCRCGLDIEYPVPSVHGYRMQYCNNGHEVPCTPGARANLRTFCPYCGSEIDTREAPSISIAMVGAVGAGKTTLMLSSVDSITKAARTRDVTVEAVTPGISKAAVSAKSVAPKTPSGELDAESMFVRSGKISDRQVMFYDISGHEFEPREGKSLFEEYYNYVGGILFVYDPLSFGRQRAQPPQEVFESFEYMFSTIKGVGPSMSCTVPFAVVATRKETTGLSDKDVRSNLESNGQGGMVKIIESMFTTVRYFSVESLGDDPTVAKPVWWIVSQSDMELASAVPIDLK